MPSSTFSKDDQVRHPEFGIGSVVASEEATTIVRFLHGLEECETSKLTREYTVAQAAAKEIWDSPLSVITLGQAAAIRSVNDTWGVFSRSRIALLPHQLWVCRQVNATWPTRWMVADDVGLGKTIEAGLILLPLRSKKVVQRLLILCPAGLVDQWQERLRTMFDIRVRPYITAADTPKSDFWGTNHEVIASLQTLRGAKTEKQMARLERFYSATAWDLLMVDEAHHLNADEETGPTLAYKLVQKLVKLRKVDSMVFFSGTPHRGKNYGFLSMLRLLYPDRFDPKQPLESQLPLMRDVMIRNNKQNVTDLKGELLFKPPTVDSVTYTYSEREAEFYRKLTEFITTGKAYASSLNAADQRIVVLVLISMQKLASSSVAAIRRAIKGRLNRIKLQRKKVRKMEVELKTLQQLALDYQEYEELNAHDELSKMEEEVAEESDWLRLMENEQPRLEELVAAADLVTEETKIKEILQLLDARFSGKSVLFFTEYKATQAMLTSALMHRYGDDCVSFINGDDRLEGVIDSRGTEQRLEIDRDDASDKFNNGEIQFLISTEAGGEGRDLQENCHCLVHVDLPWNPMRLHQRVGRINRYGQEHAVEVISLRNPDTVESRIWDRLNEKINRINKTLSYTMDEPEDMYQLVLGMTTPALFRELFTEASTVPAESLTSWFDKKTAAFGGQSALETVRQMVGSCAKFDFQQVSDEIPQVDLPAMQPFFESMLALNSRRPTKTENTMTFLSPDDWRDDPAVSDFYEEVGFDRTLKGKDGLKRVLGVGHKLVDRAVDEALNHKGRAATITASALKAPLALLRVRDRVTNQPAGAVVRVVGVAWSFDDAEEPALLKDWELLERLNDLCKAPGVARSKSSIAPGDLPQVQELISKAEQIVADKLDGLDIAFKVPMVESLALLWPAPKGRVGEETEEGDDMTDGAETAGA